MTGLAAGVTALMCLLTLWPVQAQAAELPIQSRAALLMEKTTGQVLFAQNEHEALEPASVTKVMTLLLTMEAIDSGTIHYDDVVTVSADGKLKPVKAGTANVTASVGGTTVRCVVRINN